MLLGPTIQKAQIQCHIVPGKYHCIVNKSSIFNQVKLPLPTNFKLHNVRCMNSIGFGSQNQHALSNIYTQEGNHRAKNRQTLSNKKQSESSISKYLPTNFEESDSSGDECLGILLRAAGKSLPLNFMRSTSTKTLFLFSCS